MTEPGVWTFFYGSYINLNVLREVSYVPEKWDVARLAGFDIRIQPRANLVPSERLLPPSLNGAETPGWSATLPLPDYGRVARDTSIEYSAPRFT